MSFILYEKDLTEKKVGDIIESYFTTNIKELSISDILNNEEINEIFLNNIEIIKHLINYPALFFIKFIKMYE